LATVLEEVRYEVTAKQWRARRVAQMSLTCTRAAAAQLFSTAHTCMHEGQVLTIEVLNLNI
jgi:hypothetical protein